MNSTGRLGASLGLSLTIAAAQALAVDIKISCGAVGQERALCESAAQVWAQESGNSVSFDTPPDNTNERYFKYLIDLGEEDDQVDVYQIDVIWPGLLARYLVDLKEYLPAADFNRHIPEIIDNNTVDGRLVGMPWYTDVGMLYYRKDLLETYKAQVPTDWSELADTAVHIQSAERAGGHEKIWGFVFQGAAYEGLTCNALEWLTSSGATPLLNEEGEVALDESLAALVLSRAAGWVGTISPPRVTAFNEGDSLNTFQLGDAVFMRNWPYAWAVLNGPDSPVAGKVGITPLPRGGPFGRSVSTLGGWQLAVSKFSHNPEVAADLVRYLTSEPVQRARAIEGSYLPTIASLYEDPELLEAAPFLVEVKPALEGAVARPSDIAGPKYMAFSTRFWEAVNNTLIGRGGAAENLARLKDQVRLIRAAPSK
jgi:trehalose/maltose transport system substrate-binding protein